jgi:hypothetical protein
LNIQWARENEYPAEKIQKLKEREEKCKKLMAEEVKDPADDPMEIFKLSYPANPKIPFIVDCLELRIVNDEPRLYTTRDLKPGDIVSNEKLILSRICDIALYIRCCYCIERKMLNFLPCLKTASLMFCSLECRNKTYELHGNDLDSMLVYGRALSTDRLIRDIQDAFGGHEELLKFLKENDLNKMKKTIFDFDWREDAEKKKIFCLLSANTSHTTPTFYTMSSASFKLIRGITEFKNLQSKLFKTLQLYNFPILNCARGIGQEGLGFSTLNSIHRHSCLPNLDVIGVDGRIYYFATRPIKAGEELFTVRK